MPARRDRVRRVASDSQPVFFYDLSSPYAYLAATRVDRVLPVAPRWQPGWIIPIVGASGREWRRTGEENLARQEEVEQRASDYGLPPVHWPQRYLDGRTLGMDAEPVNALATMRLATFAERAGAGKDFALRVYELAFADGRDVTQLDDAVIEAAVACGLDPGESRAAVADPEIKLALKQATEAAIERGVIGLPTVAVGGQLFWGDDRLEEA